MKKEIVRAFEKEIMKMMQAGITAQCVRVRDEWGPGIAHALAQIPDLCRITLLPMVAAAISQEEQPGHSEDVLFQAARETVRIASERTEVVKSILRDMVRTEFRCSAEILTINGVAAAKPKLEELHPDPEHTLRVLSHAKTMDHYLPIFLGLFLRQVATALRSLAYQYTHPEALVGDLEKALNGWRQRLQTLAKTITTSVFDETKRAVGACLNPYPV